MERTWAQRATYRWARRIVRLLGWLVVGLRFRGRELFPATGGALVCSNHQSYLDPVLVGAMCDRRLNYLARKDLFDQRWLGPLIRWFDAIPVDRDGLGIGGVKETLRRLRRGEFVLMFPEGTRTSDGAVGELRAGFCLLVRRAQVPLVPVGIDGAYAAWPRHASYPRWASIRLVAAPPITPQQYAGMSDDELMTTLHGQLVACQQSAQSWRSRS